MKLIQRTVTLLVFSSALVFTNTAFAYYQLTYTSNTLPYLQGYLGGEPYDVESDQPSYASFNVLFDNISESTSPQTLSGSGLVNVVEPSLSESIPITSGSLTLGADGIPTAWNFSFQFTKSTPGVRDLELDENGETIYFNEFTIPSKTSWLLESSYGADTCNCEKYRYDGDIYVERPYYSWAYANTIGFLYGAESSPDNWSAKKVDVPEPNTYLLFVLGLIIIGVRKVCAEKII